MSGNVDDFGDHFISEFKNQIPLNMVMLTFFLILCYFKKYLKLLPTVVFFLSVAFFIIIVSATRKAFGGIVILVFFAFLPYFMKRSWKSTFAFIGLLLLYYGTSHLMESSFLGERMAEGYDRQIGLYEKGTFLYYMGDRAYMYVDGWQLFLENMWTGIGLKNFMEVGNSDFVLHTEYMVQLTECGLIGTSLYLAFNVFIIFNLVKALKRKENLNQTMLCLGLIGAILFISFTAWTYAFPIYFIALGIVIGHYKRLNNENSDTKPHTRVS